MYNVSIYSLSIISTFKEGEHEFLMFPSSKKGVNVTTKSNFFSIPWCVFWNFYAVFIIIFIF